VIFANDLMQGSLPRAGITIKRFAINSTAGVGGLFDVADRLGLRYHDDDFGLTLAVWGVGEGPYLVAPILGPSNPRDLTGYGVDSVMDPWGWILPGRFDYLKVIRAAAAGIDLRARNLDTLEQIQKGALDYYATLRSLYRQHRRDQIKKLKEEKDTSLMAMPDQTAQSPQQNLSN
jgi:phospholipid-binding lipoprotein MlaA